MIFVLVVSCLMVIYWGGFALDETVVPLLFSLTDGKIPAPDAFGDPMRLFTAVITYSEAVFIVLQISVLLLEPMAFIYMLCKKKFSLPSKIIAGLGIGFTVIFIALPSSIVYILPLKALLSMIYLVLISLQVKQYRKIKS